MIATLPAYSRVLDALDDVVDADKDRHELGGEAVEARELLLDEVRGCVAVDRRIADELEAGNARRELVRPTLILGDRCADGVRVTQRDEAHRHLLIKRR